MDYRAALSRMADQTIAFLPGIVVMNGRGNEDGKYNQEA
jgi:hypothetical protein